MAFRNADSKVGFGNSDAVNAPAGLAQNDIIRLSWNNGGGYNATISWPAGFTEDANASRNGGSGYDGPYTHKTAWKRAGGGEPATYTVSSNVTDFYTLKISANSGRSTTVDPPTPQVSNDANNNASPFNIGATGVTASDGDDILYDVAGQPGGSNTYTYTPPTNYTERLDIACANYQSSSLATRDNVSAGATGTLTGTATGSSSGGWSAIVSAIPAAAGASVPTYPQIERNRHGISRGVSMGVH